MLFNTSLFLLYFLPVFLLVYYLIPNKARNYWALLASLGLFAWGAPAFFLTALIAIILNFFLCQLLDRNRKRKLLWLTLAVVMNLGLLLYFKYMNFFLENTNLILDSIGQKEFRWTSIILPLGISFITFHQLSYIFDVSREEKKPLRNIAEYALYVLYFPRLIAGPIIKYGEMAEALKDRRHHENINERLAGFFRFGIGLAKKVLIADILASQAGLIFSTPMADLSTPMAWFGLLIFSLQIYFDFSAYSDMAIGLARMMGFIFPENFDNPYISKSITEFWRRWHITLSSFLRDYLYMPLAVKMRNSGKIGISIALMITFILCGMWHEAGWNFILWGALQGLLLVADVLFMGKILKKMPGILAGILTFLIVSLGWVLFRCESPAEALTFYTKLFTRDPGNVDILFNTRFYVILGISTVFSFIGFHPKIRSIQMKLFGVQKNLLTQIIFTIIGLIFIFVSVASITAYGFHPFIYASF